MKLESNIERTACNAVKKTLKVHSLKLNVRGQRGWPDRIFFIPGGRPLLIEYKRPGEVLRPMQKYRVDFLRRLGYDVKVCVTLHETIEAIARALAAARLSKTKR